MSRPQLRDGKRVLSGGKTLLADAGVECCTCECPAWVYWLNGCCSGRVLTFTASDLSAWVGQTVKYNDLCATVSRVCNQCANCTNPSPTYVALVQGVDLACLDSCIDNGDGTSKKFRITTGQTLTVNTSFELAADDPACQWLYVYNPAGVVESIQEVSYTDSACGTGESVVDTMPVTARLTKTDATTWQFTIKAGDYYLFKGSATVDSGDCMEPVTFTNEITACDPDDATTPSIAQGGTVSVFPTAEFADIDPAEDFTSVTGCEDEACPDCCVECANCCYSTESRVYVLYSYTDTTPPTPGSDPNYDAYFPSGGTRMNFLGVSIGSLFWKLDLGGGVFWEISRDCSTGEWRFNTFLNQTGWGESDCCPNGGTGDPDGDRFTSATFDITIVGNNCCNSGDGCTDLGEQDCETGECEDLP